MQSNQVTFLNLKKHPAILFKQGSRAVLLTDLADTAKTYRYSIQPCLDSNRVINLITIAFAKDTVTSFFKKSGNLIRFLDKDILIYDKTLQSEQIIPKLKADYVFITGNPREVVSAIDKNYHYQRLIVDAGNNDSFISLLKMANLNNNKKMYVLKRNKSLILQSEY